jgi:hypothetical protein
MSLSLESEDHEEGGVLRSRCGTVPTSWEAKAAAASHAGVSHASPSNLIG